MPPFVVFSLPRSRSAWMMHWLSAVSGERVGHDTAIEADTVDGWLETILRRMRGTCETGAVGAWPILRRAIPDCRIVTVQRPLADVVASLARLGLTAESGILEIRDEQLAMLARQPGVLAVQYHELRDPRMCAAIQAHCLDSAFNWPVWEYFDRNNITVDIGPRMARVAERGPMTTLLKAEVEARKRVPSPFVSVGEEQWVDIRAEFEVLGADHHAEATEEIEGPYRIDHAVFTAMDNAGQFRVFVARVDGVMAGYCFWTKEINAESDMPPAMKHGPFYVAPDYARHRLGKRLIEVSRAVLAADGYRALKLHHTMRGSRGGARVGRFYQSLGAAEYQREYILRIGG